MNYSQIYKSPYPKMIELTLKDLLKDGIKSARIRSNDRQIIEVLEKDKALAEIKIKDYQNILLTLINTSSDKIYSADDEKKFLSEFVNRDSTKKFNFKGRLLKIALISSVYI